MRPNRLNVPLRNFARGEADCRCGCGKEPDPELMVRAQAFIYYLEAVYSAPIRVIVTGPVRCGEHNKAVYGGERRESYHVGIERVENGQPGAAIDGRYQICKNETWENLDKAHVAQHAVDSKLFGGVGWMIYGSGQNFVHTDIGPVREF